MKIYDTYIVCVSNRRYYQIVNSFNIQKTFKYIEIIKHLFLRLVLNIPIFIKID